MSFENELNYLNLNEEQESLNQRIVLTQDEVDDILKEYPTVPADFIDYLQEIGIGNIMSSQFKVYGKLLDFVELGLDDIYELPSNTKLFGDNFSGDFSGFDLSKENTDEVVEFWHDSNEVYYTGKTFREFVREKMLMSTT